MVPRLSTYPNVVVRIACSSCPRAGSYRLARLAERYGAEMGMRELLAKLAADCPRRSIKRFKGEYDRCGAHFPDLGGRSDPEPPDTHSPASAMRVVGGRR